MTGPRAITMDVKLSICILTYNRARLLAQTLESVFSQALDQVEVVIGDNASADNTEEIVCAYQKKFPRLTYIRQPENIGAERNCLSVVRQAQGEYCWLLSDDDLLDEGAVAYVLENYLNGSRPIDFLLAMYTSYDYQMQNILMTGATELGVTEDLYTRDILSFFKNFFCEVCLSVYIVKREKWNSVQAEKYMETMLPQVGIVYEYLELDSPVQVVSKSLVKYRSSSGDTNWTQNTLELLAGHVQTVLGLLPSRYDPVKSEAEAGFHRRFPITLKMLAALRSDNYYHLGLYRSHVFGYFRGRRLYQALSLLIAILPVAVIRKIRVIYKSRKEDHS